MRLLFGLLETQEMVILKHSIEDLEPGEPKLFPARFHLEADGEGQTLNCFEPRLLLGNGAVWPHAASVARNSVLRI